MSKLLTVIIPAYNAEKSVRSTVESVLNQDIKDVDVLVVDDGSVDNTLKILQQIALKDNRVKAISQSNSGAYAARLYGVEVSTSKYIAFVDADDTVEPSMYGKMLQIAESHDLDVVECGVYGEPQTGHVEFFRTKDEVLEKYSIPSIIEARGSAFVWNKVYNRRVWNVKTRDAHILMFEDLDINFQIFHNVEKMAVIHEGLYHYQVNDLSSVRNFKEKNIRDFHEAIRIRQENITKYRGFSRDSVEMHLWVLKNARNLLVSAASANIDMTAKVNAAMLITELPEFRESFNKITGSGVKSRWTIVFNMMKVIGTKNTMALISWVKHFQQIIKNIFKK